MSKINPGLPCWAPPIFPAGGRLPIKAEQVNANYHQQFREAEAYKNSLNQQQGNRLNFPCCHSLHISIFFDGTGNNEENDTNQSDPPHPTNIARLYHASYKDADDSGYFRYYIPGVGTPFPKINEFEYSMSGLAFAAGGEDRINWALLRVVDALMYAVNADKSRLKDETARVLITQMRALLPAIGRSNRRSTINRLLQPLQRTVQYARPHLLNIKLFIYGFSRGAAEARTFVNWLTELFPLPEGAEKPEMKLLGLDVSIEFLGILDTVPSVGIAHVAPGATGHMGWANGTQQLPDEVRFPGLIKCCRHFIAAHEQRLSFPLDSVRRPEGSYPANTLEVVYPGMHSNVGGGYPPGEQGKSLGGTGELQSQIVLHDLYLAAFEAGAPLRVRPDQLTPLTNTNNPSREMSLDSVGEFILSEKLITRFNIWRQTLMNDVPASDATSAPTEPGYRPYQLPAALESVVAQQMAWLTGWRIGRYANHSLLTQPFYLQAPQHSPEQLKQDLAAWQQRQKSFADRLTRTNRQQADWQDQVGQGSADYDPVNARYQLREAAREFEHDYHSWYRDVNGSVSERSKQVVLDVILKYPVYLTNGDDEDAEYQQMKKAGDYHAGWLFTDRLGSATRKLPMAELVAFYDDHIHDSRAWFLQSTLGGREMWGGYFRYRMIYFGDYASKQTRLISVEGRVIGATTSDRVSYSVRRTRQAGIVTEVHRVTDLADGRVQVLSGPQLCEPNACQAQIATHYGQQIRDEELAAFRARLPPSPERKASHQA